MANSSFSKNVDAWKHLCCKMGCQHNTYSKSQSLSNVGTRSRKGKTGHIPGKKIIIASNQKAVINFLDTQRYVLVKQTSRLFQYFSGEFLLSIQEQRLFVRPEGAPAGTCPPCGEALTGFFRNCWEVLDNPLAKGRVIHVLLSRFCRWNLMLTLLKIPKPISSSRCTILKFQNVYIV